MLCLTERICARNPGALHCYQSGFLTGWVLHPHSCSPCPGPHPRWCWGRRYRAAPSPDTGRPEAQESFHVARVWTMPGRDQQVNSSLLLASWAFPRHICIPTLSVIQLSANIFLISDKWTKRIHKLRQVLVSEWEWHFMSGRSSGSRIT